ncbi:PIN-like domain-containing protein [Spirillospora sp. CA-108201]
MSDEAIRDEASETKASSLRSMFPWHFGPPTGDQLERFLTEGLVVFDTNALFDVYRLNPQGRGDFLHTLNLLGDKLWVPHRVAEEFLLRRLTVIDECARAVANLTSDVKGSFNKIRTDLETFRGRRGLDKPLVDELVKRLKETEQQIIQELGEAYRFDLKASDCLTGDPILSEIEKLLEGRIGPVLENMRQVREDAAYRFERRIPPGFADARKPPEQAIGDYVLWAELLQEVERLPRPVLFVTNEKKKAEDWTVKQPGGRSPLPRPELSAEVWHRAGQPFHIVDVRSFLELANEYVDAQVSEETITQAEEIRSEADEEDAASDSVEDSLAHVLHGMDYPPGSNSFQSAVRNIASDSAAMRNLFGNSPMHTSAIEQAMRNLTHTNAIEQAMRNMALDSPMQRAMRNFTHNSALQQAMRNFTHTSAIEQAMRNLQGPSFGRPAARQDPAEEDDGHLQEPPREEPQ